MKKKDVNASDEALEVVEATEEKTTAVAVPEIPKTFVFRIEDKEMNEKILKDKVAEFKALTITGIDDKTGYDAIKKAKSELVKTRTTLEKIRKEAAEPHLAFLSDIKTTSDSWGAICKDGEKYLVEEIEKYDKLKADEKKRKEEEALLVLQTRISDLNSFGATFENGVYRFAYAPGIVTNTVSLREMSEESYEDFYDVLRMAFEEEQERIKKEQSEKEEADKAIIAQAEQNQLELVNLNKKRTKLREKELTLAGLELGSSDGGWFYDRIENDRDQPKCLVNKQDIETLPDEDWEALIEDIQGQIDDLNTPVLNVPAEPELHEDKEVGHGLIDFVNNEGGIVNYNPAFDVKADLVNGRHLDSTFPEHIVAEKPDEAERNWKFRAEGELTHFGVVLKFDAEKPFIEIEVSKTFQMRVYPLQYVLQARKGVTNDLISFSGEIQEGLPFIIYKKLVG